MEKKSKKANEIALVKLVVRLCICMVAIGAMFLCESVSGGFVVKAQSTNSGDSFSTEQQTVNLLLNKRKDTDNVAFKVSNMFPGDAVTGNYCVKVSYEDAVMVSFRVDISEKYDKLAEVLKCKIVLAATGEVLHDGLMKEVPDAVGVALTDIQSGERELVYEITAYLDTSVGNEYQNKALEADFVWWIEVAEGEETDNDEGSDQTPSDSDEGSDQTLSDTDKEDGQTPSDTDKDEEGAESAVTDESSPETVNGDKLEHVDAGDDTNLILWLVVAACAVVVLIVAILKKQKGGHKV